MIETFDRQLKKEEEEKKVATPVQKIGNAMA
jgi:hypothetical protein